MLRRLKGSVGVLIVFGVLLGVGVAAAAPSQTVTHGDPFASCPALDDGFGGVLYPSTEPEVWLAANPADPNNLIGVAQQDRWSDGGAQGLVATYSRDGGHSWHETPLPFSSCASSSYSGNIPTDRFLQPEQPYNRASDPWVSIGPDGTAYAVSISFNGFDGYGGAVEAATSSDGGQIWQNQQIITDEPNDENQIFDDKESVTADPAHAGVAYAVWDRSLSVACPSAVAPNGGSSSDDRAHGNVEGASTALALDCSQDVGMFSKTTNSGDTWSTPIPIVPTSANPVETNAVETGNEIVVDPSTGTIYDFFAYFDADGNLAIENVASHDGGASWSEPQVVSADGWVGITDPATGASIRSADYDPAPAIDPSTGQLYVVWQDAGANSTDPNEDALFISTSSRSGGGATGTWSPPTPVNEPGDEAAFTPAVAVLGNGSVAVQYYVLRNKAGKHGHGPHGPHAAPPKPPKGKLPVLTTGVVIRFTDGPGTNFHRHEQPVGDDFNMLAATYASGFFTGDYEGLAADVRDPKSVHTFFDAATCKDSKCAAIAGFDDDGNPIPSNAHNPDDVYSGSVRPG